MPLWHAIAMASFWHGFPEVVGPYVYQAVFAPEGFTAIDAAATVARHGLEFNRSERGADLRRPLRTLLPKSADRALAFATDAAHPLHMASLAPPLGWERARLCRSFYQTLAASHINVSLFGEEPQCLRDAVLSGGSKYNHSCMCP